MSAVRHQPGSYLASTGAFGSRHEEAPGEDRGFIAEEDFPGIVHVRCGDLLCDDTSAANVTRVTNLAESPSLKSLGDTGSSA